jgi:hypothetical protein
MQPILNLNIVDKELFGNDAGEDEKIEILNSYYVERDDLHDFYDKSVKLNVVREALIYSPDPVSVTSWN